MLKIRTPLQLSSTTSRDQRKRSALTIHADAHLRGFPALGGAQTEHVQSFHPDLVTPAINAPYRIFTARAASSASVASEIADWIIISALAQRESTGTSVGENAVLVLNARNR
jgi:hypothetical protein